MATFDLNDDSVVIIIGSGAGGGTLCNELCQKGIKVVLLEAGGMQSSASFINDEWKSFSQLAWLDNRTTSGTWRVAKDFPNLPAWVCKTVGGTTTHWAGASLRLQEHEFRALTHYGPIKDTSLMDWPLTLAELEPYYSRAEDRMGVTRTHGIPGLPGNNNFRVLYAGASRLGYKEVHTGNMAINSQARDDRGRCLQLGFCFQGCKSGAKWSTLYTELPKAEKTGNLELRSQCHVTRIEHDAKGKVTGVLYADKDGKEQRQKGRLVCVAGNSIETPRLLLLSASNLFKDGLANSSGQVGRNYMRHMTGSVYALFKDPVHMYRGTTMAGIVRDEADNDPRRGFVGGYEMETLALGLPFMAAFLNPGAWGPAFTEYIDNYVNIAGMWLVGEDMPRQTNRVTLHPTLKDQWGNAIPNVHFDDHAERRGNAQPRVPPGAARLRGRRCGQVVPHAALSVDPQPGNVPHGRVAGDERLQRLWPDPRHRQPVHLRWQPVHHRRRREPDADDRDTGNPPGRVHCQADVGSQHLATG